ncbi:MAG: hypothetical protein COW88_01420 [Candidatus Lloydbacteria bacterium CG22_combo_CG10-13_8_21_14_all_47_15]|uniref:DUF2914 domain-containing protein n=1 Tax=Candidatus Lloydbacteria bacterium CG22_combo_CG10-13_8_21_14_all_47_15 TaxID=1974635 RepID=A0A2H0CW03_9BACT|nr:MAG: hypothetical protein COW88_01420 [Candidatus Lloydbacteria bacterium CG22_combo_CG10-13_8_21_14_all_47_15]
MLELFKEKYTPYKRHLSTAAFAAGFLWDSITLTRIDLWIDNLILFSYLVIAGAGIFVLNIGETGRSENRFLPWLASWAPVIIQFAFGGLFSGYMIFYTRSASLVSSWPFLLILFWLLVGNEFFEERYRRLQFQTGIFFVTIFSFFIFYIPVILGSYGVGIFLLSGIVSLFAIRLFVFALSKKIPERVALHKRSIVGCIGGIYLAINALYFTNIIPPIPLALKDIGIYHFAERMSGENYAVLGEEKTWGDAFRATKEFHYRAGEPAYVYSAVFAPTKLNTTIFHRWEYFDALRDEWIETDRVSFSIAGGRDGGYRGYSVKENIFPSLWRVDVINTRGQLLGRVKFDATEVLAPPALEAAVL